MEDGNALSSDSDLLPAAFEGFLKKCPLLSVFSLCVFPNKNQPVSRCKVIMLLTSLYCQTVKGLVLCVSRVPLLAFH